MSFGQQMDNSTARKRFVFHGQASEYFGIWVVNILLTIVTLGIYSAWAKVRTKRYFYGNAELDGTRFSYLAKPMQILIGRIIVLVFLVIYNLVANLFPIFGIALSIALLLALPELVRRGIRFNARVSAYRNVRFDFVGGYGGAFLAMVLGPLITILTLGLAAPVSSAWSQSYVTNNMRYGGRPFAMTAKIGDFYKALWLPLFLVLGLILVLIILSAASYGGAVLSSGVGGLLILLGQIGFVVIYILTLVIFGIAGLLYAAAVRNIAFNATTVDQKHALVSSVDRWGYAWLIVSNFLASVATAGLLRPWAAVRHAKFLADATALDVSGQLSDYTDQVYESTSAISSEYMDIDGVDIGL